MTKKGKDKRSALRVAIVHNWFFKMRGGERVVKSLCEIFPDADLYALFGDKRFLAENFQGKSVKFTWLQRLPFIKRIYKVTLPFWPMAIESLKFHEYDLVISTSASVAHGVITPLGTTHVSYIFTPMRYLWDQKDLYMSKYSRVRKFFVSPILHYLRVWDVGAFNRPDYLIAVSGFVNKRLLKFYGRGADFVLNPPVDISNCKSSKKRSNYYLALSPFEENKGAEAAIELAIANKATLKLTGDGRTKKRLQKKYSKHKNIQFLGWVSEKEKYKLLSKAKGLFFLGEEDFGIAAIEAIASGCPVIAYNNGAVAEIRKKLGGIYIIKQGSSKIPKTDPLKIEKKKLMHFSDQEFKKEFRKIVKTATASV
ncbi:MAG: glycosyltransferase [Candidatus Dojkabacteria bacterium]|nr:MAG: glycosyltransferase [Candidatus Dojkabacteria bacterium]